MAPNAKTPEEGPVTGGTAITRRCPFCGSDRFKVISLFGSQVMTMQCRCESCGNYFEATKY